MRLFVALALPLAVRTRLSWMAGGLPGARWVPPENYHVTLRFIGEVPGWRAEEIDHALASVRASAFEMSLCGVGVFDRAGKVTSLWVGVERQPALDHLQARVEAVLQRSGLEPERKRFTPHITLARLDGVPERKVAAWVQERNLFRSEPMLVEYFTLFRSRLGKEQAVYDPEVEYQLRTYAGAADI